MLRRLWSRTLLGEIQARSFRAAKSHSRPARRQLEELQDRLHQQHQHEPARGSQHQVHGSNSKNSEACVGLVGSVPGQAKVQNHLVAIHLLPKQQQVSMTSTETHARTHARTITLNGHGSLCLLFNLFVAYALRACITVWHCCLQAFSLEADASERVLDGDHRDADRDCVQEADLS